MVKSCRFFAYWLTDTKLNPFFMYLTLHTPVCQMFFPSNTISFYLRTTLWVRDYYQSVILTDDWDQCLNQGDDGKVMSLRGAIKWKGEWFWTPWTSLKNEKCHFPTWSGGQYQCRRLKRRKVFNTGNCAHLVLEGLGSRRQRHSLGFKVTSQQLCPDRRKSPSSHWSPKPMPLSLRKGFNLSRHPMCSRVPKMMGVWIWTSKW